MRKNNRTYSPSLNTLLVSVAVATIPGMGYAAYSTTDCNNFKNIYPTAFSNLGCSGWNNRCSWDAFRAELISVCNTKGQDIDCEESAESGVLAAILGTDCHLNKNMTTAELCAANSNDADLKACFATGGGGTTPGTTTKCSSGQYKSGNVCYTCPTFSTDSDVSVSSPGTGGKTSCYVQKGKEFNIGNHTAVFVYDCPYPDYNS